MLGLRRRVCIEESFEFQPVLRSHVGELYAIPDLEVPRHDHASRAQLYADDPEHDFQSSSYF